MTFADDCVHMGKLTAKWIAGLTLACLGIAMIFKSDVPKCGVAFVIGGIFILRPEDLTQFFRWSKDNVAGLLQKPGDCP